VSALEQRRFSRDSIRHYIRRADALCRWLHDQGIALVEANQKHIQAYDVYDVLLDLDPPRLEVRKTKFNKSRLVPIHETVADKLRQYAELRHRLNYDALSDYFFVSEQGSRIRYKALYSAFQKLVSSLGIEAREGSRRPSLHSFRHGFAVDRLRTWYQQGVDVRAHLPQLSVYLGHLEPTHTYWYLSATPELLSEAARSFAAYAMEGGEQ
jgi:integrase/recombinase XerD